MPVGTILPYIGSQADIPRGWHLCDGTDGTPNLLDNRFLEGSATIGTFKEPGLPNIIGVINGVYNGSGAFKWLGIDGNKYASGTGNFGTDQFDASFSNPIYGKSNTVQPASYTVYYIIKIK